jgi:hypothetical protein
MFEIIVGFILLVLWIFSECDIKIGILCVALFYSVQYLRGEYEEEDAIIEPTLIQQLPIAAPVASLDIEEKVEVEVEEEVAKECDWLYKSNCKEGS